MSYVYQQKAVDRIKKSLIRLSHLVAKGIEAKYQEADTRKIVEELLAVLGWDKFDNVTSEQMINSNYADYVVKTQKEELFVIEVKRIGMTLKKEHLSQAKTYAVDEGISYLVLTNADVWEVYKIIFEGKVPNTKLVFKVSLSDKETSNADKAALLYLLSEEANRKKELDDYYEYRSALSGESLATQLLTDNCLNTLRLNLKKATGQKLTNGEIAEALISKLFRETVLTEQHLKAVQRLRRKK